MATPPRRVLFLTQIYPSSREPAYGVFNFQTFQAIAHHCEARVVAPRPWWTRVRRPAELLRPPSESLGGLLAHYPTIWKAPRLAPAWNGELFYRSLRPVVAHLRREFPFDAVAAAFVYPDGAAAARIAAEHHCPLIIRAMGSDVNLLGQQPETRELVRDALCRCRRIIAVSDALRDRIVDLGIEPRRIAVIRNAVDGERFLLRDRKEARVALGLPQDRRIISYVGRLEKEKGSDVLVEAIARLKAQGQTNVMLTLVGHGSMEAALRRRVAELGLEPRVRFCGVQPHSEIPLWHSAGDLLCLPSHREGCPNVVLEALASGRPVVASRVGGVPELLDGTNGVMVSPGDPEALAAALEETLSREWAPEALRASVRSLSWDVVGRLGWDLITAAMDEWALEGSRAATYGSPIGELSMP